LLAAALAVLTTGCRFREQTEGRYAFTAVNVLKDECVLVPGTNALFGADFIQTGNVVRLEYDWFSMILAGAYFDRALGDSAPERFFADGTAQNVQATKGAQLCEVDAAVAHLEAETDSPTTFHGTLRLSYEDVDTPACNCETWVNYQAVRQ
jgi:hypothetical protein